ncbi:bifunctional RNase H/acid phosphatase [Streptomyces variabilis]|uniref:Bifunctional RNase H/acid phosphatase n=2 Tax=Streptomyces TaxID=1883 RepID=A0ABQ2TZ40_9ACTN|nr:bifunctional RNase H/acid phosphatase [Streptomyces variabilis]GGP34896.1 bifunctional RNase H/acid phosphatase [Streptomyces griseoincarnatus]GGT55805.1 bifunctional RNase H/acid phosphatase [Streptomyces variabilis]
MREFVVEADGGSRGNPGPAGYGAVVSDAATGETLAEAAEYIGVATNNVAEYRGLLAGLRVARELDPDARVRVRMDSKLVVEQMSGRWKIKHPAMKPLAAQAATVFPPDRVTYEWIPRESNTHADRLANEAMDAGRRGESWSPAESRADLDTPPTAPVAPAPEGTPGDATAGAARVREALASAGGAAAPGEPEPERRPAAEGTAAAGAADTAGTVRGRSTEDASGEEPDTEPGPGADDTQPGSRADDTEAADVQGGRGVEGDSGGAGGPAPTGRARGRRAGEPRATGVRAAGASGEGPEVGGPGRPGGRGVEGDSGGAGGPAPTDRARGRRAAEPPATGVRAAGASGEGPADGGPGRPAGPAPADADRRAAQAVATPSSGWAPADMGAPATFVLLRHGETPLTPQKRFSGSGGSDPSLSDIGREQAGKVAAALARRGTVQAVVASPLARTRETARIVAARLGLDVAVEDGLRETDFGAWEGLTFGEVRERYPEDLDAWLASPDAEPTGGGESFAATAARVAEARDRLLAEYRGRTVLLVTHVTPVKMMIRLALGAPPEALFRMELSAASLSAVAYYADGNASVRLFNDTSHLR